MPLQLQTRLQDVPFCQGILDAVGVTDTTARLANLSTRSFADTVGITDGLVGRLVPSSIFH